MKQACNEKKKRVIYHGFSDQNRCLIVDKLEENYNWQPIMMLGSDGESKSMQEWSCRYPELILLDTMRLRTANFDYNYIGDYTPIDKEVLEKLSQYESNYLDNLDDVTGWSFSFTERREFYHGMLKYMNSLLFNFRPELVVFSTWPHTPSCLALYYLCKHYLKINTIFLDAIPYFDGRYSGVSNSLENLHSPFMDIYNSDSNLTLDDDVVEYLEDLRSVEGKTTGHIIEDYLDSKRFPLSLIKKLILLTKNKLLGKISEHEKLIEWKKNRKHFSLKSSRLSNYEYLFFRLKLIFKNKILFKFYKSLCTDIDSNDKYIYFAANYQPEATTLPTGGAFEEISLVIDILSKYTPKGWVIYYKEHPYTFEYNSLSTLSKRSKLMYKKIAKYSNVKFILPSENSFQLISGAKAVASIGGTSVWEAAVRGIPSICFGSVWYRGCKSIFSIDTINDMKNAFHDIENGYIPDSEDVDRYAASVAHTSVKGMISDRFEKSLRLSKEQDVEIIRIACAIYDAHEKLNRSEL